MAPTNVAGVKDTGLVCFLLFLHLALPAFHKNVHSWHTLDIFDVYAALYESWVWRNLESIPAHNLDVL